MQTTFELKIPAVKVGINVEAGKDDFRQATRGQGNYVMTLNTFNRSVVVNETTKPFVDGYVKRFGETPIFTADTYSAIIYNIVPVIEMTGTLDADRLMYRVMVSLLLSLWPLFDHRCASAPLCRGTLPRSFPM